MPYLANVFSVFIASPSDVKEERTIVRQILSDWNAVNSRAHGMLLQPLGWETDVYPSLGSGPQEEVNRQILENADVLVGVFWTRLGTPTANHPSGTVEEIKKHYDAGRPVMVYFSKQPVRMDSVEQDQYSKLKEFIAWCEGEGIVEHYEDLSEFTTKFNRQLGLLVNGHSYFQQYATEQHSSNASEPSRPEVDILAALDEDSKRLLSEASQDRNGNLLKIHMLGGMKVQTNGKAFGSENRDPRVEAELEEAISNLESQGLIEATNIKREVFRVTAMGYRVAELLT